MLFPPQRNGPGRKALAFKASTALFILHIFIAGNSFKGKRGLFSDFQCFGLCILFPYSVSDNVFASGATLTQGLHVRTLLATDRCIQSVAECGESHRRLRDCFGSPVFQCGSTIRGGITKRTMALQPWNNSMMKGTLLRRQLFFRWFHVFSGSD